MIFDTQMFKKMLKREYMGIGLNVAKEKGRYIFTGSYWYMAIRSDAFPKKARAAAIELIGEFPASGESFVIRDKDEKKPEAGLSIWKGIIMDCQIPAEDIYFKTKLALNTTMETYRLWQNGNGEIVTLNDIASEIVGAGNIDKECETNPEGPYKVGEIKGSSIMYWANNACEFFVLEHKIEDEENRVFLKMAEDIKLPATTQKER